MGRGMSHCRICGKPVPSFYRRRHEKFLCLRMRYLRGDVDVVARVLAKALPLPVKVCVKKPLPRGQRRLLEVMGDVF